MSINCPKCKTKNPINASFCQECGKKIKADGKSKISSNICPNCKTENSNTASFCRNCGINFRTSTRKNSFAAVENPIYEVRGVYNKKSVVVNLEWDRIIITSKIRMSINKSKKEIDDIKYSDMVEVKRWKGFGQKGIKIKTSENKFKFVFFKDTPTKKLVEQIKKAVNIADNNIFRENDSNITQKMLFKEKIKNHNEVNDYLKAFVKKSKYDYKNGDINKLRDLLSLKGYDFNEDEIIWLVEDELDKQEYASFKLKIIHDEHDDFNSYEMNFIDSYGSNYKQYIDCFIKLMNEKGLSVDEIEYDLERIKKESELYNFEKGILEFNKDSLKSDNNEINPEKSKKWLNKGNIYYDLRNSKMAINYYNNALEHDPTNLKALNMKGLIFQNLGDINSATECYNKALHINPQNTDSWNNMGILFYDIGQIQKSAICYNMASKAYNVKPVININKSLKLLGKAPNVISEYQSFMETIASDPTSLMELADPSLITDTDPSSALDILSLLFDE